jgi:hypothetical protein
MNDEERAHSLARIAAPFYRDGNEPLDAIRKAQDLLYWSAITVRREREQVDAARELQAATESRDHERIAKSFAAMDALDWSPKVPLDEALREITAACSARNTEQRRERLVEVLGENLLARFEDAGAVSTAEVNLYRDMFAKLWPEVLSSKRSKVAKSKKS